MCMLTDTYRQNLCNKYREIKVTLCNRQADCPLTLTLCLIRRSIEVECMMLYMTLNVLIKSMHC